MKLLFAVVLVTAITAASGDELTYGEGTAGSLSSGELVAATI